MLDWLNTSLDVTRAHALPEAVAWHGRLMVLAWGMLLPVGVLIARYYKIRPQQDWPRKLDDRVWWLSHLWLQSLGGVVMLIGLWFVVRGWPAPAHPHAMLGWSIVALTLVQFLGGLFRGSKGGPTAPNPDGTLDGDHFSMTPRRLLFERVHKSAGWLALLLSIGAIATGFWHVNAPRWMPVALGAWWIVLAVIAIRLQRGGRAIDTYQAIWGPDPSLPGNRRPRPIGWGIRRLQPGSRP
jgi:hypothetical protein